MPALRSLWTLPLVFHSHSCFSVDGVLSAVNGLHVELHLVLFTSVLPALLGYVALYVDPFLMLTWHILFSLFVDMYNMKSQRCVLSTRAVVGHGGLMHLPVFRYCSCCLSDDAAPIFHYLPAHRGPACELKASWPREPQRAMQCNEQCFAPSLP